MTRYLFIPLCLGVLMSCQSCVKGTGGEGGETTGENIELIIPNINRDSVYDFVQKQVDFGPRVPGSEAHKKCSEWFKTKLEGYGATVTMQKFRPTFHFGTTVDAVNIIGAINPHHKRRVLLCAHWDSRHVADQDTERKNEAILGADDGGSGVAVLLEIARLIQKHSIDLGVDIVLFDAEDQGDSEGEGNTTLTWCLGSQYWSGRPHVAGYRAKYGILLDMVGSEGARFTKEQTSMKYAPSLMNKTWKIAADLGYSNYFVDIPTGPITDDHTFVNEIAHIPTIDIINRPADRGFGEYWHTHDDNMDVISKSALSATGNVVLAVIYNESIGQF
jgi:glutaminyl-peptide cyclotransferase